MSVAGSQFSQFKSPGSIINGKRSFLDRNGYDVPLSYYYKHMQFDTNVIIRVPQQLINQVNGDKQVNIRFIQIYDDSIATDNPLGDRANTVIRVSCQKQRNNYGIDGIQSQVIGYLMLDESKKMMIGECQMFEADSRDDIRIIFEKKSNGSTTFNTYTLPSSTDAFLYIDIEVQYDYNQNI